MAQLTKERDHLFETIRTYRLLFETTRQLINEMQGTVSSCCYRVVLKESLICLLLYYILNLVSVHEASLQEQKLRGELRKQNIPASSLATVRIKRV